MTTGIGGSLGGSPERLPPRNTPTTTQSPNIERELNWRLRGRHRSDCDLVNNIYHTVHHFQEAFTHKDAVLALFHVDSLIIYEELARRAMIPQAVLHLLYANSDMVQAALKLRRKQLERLVAQKKIPANAGMCAQIYHFWQKGMHLLSLR